MFIPVFRKPSNACAALVHEYIFMQSDNINDFYCDKYIPNGMIPIVVNFKSTVLVHDGDDQVRMPETFILPMKDRSSLREVSAPFDTIVSFCKASVLSAIFGVKFNCLQPKLVFDIDILNGFPDLGSLGSCPNIEKRLEKLESLLTSIQGLSSYKHDELDHLYLSILGERWNNPLKELHNSYAIHTRSLRRKFLERVGMTAKTLSRIIRINHCWNLAGRNPNIDYLDMIAYAGYYDHAHFIKDFKKIIGETPRQFLKRNLEQVHFISGKSQ
jgi:AraC-like DNA-binding protein